MDKIRADVLFRSLVIPLILVIGVYLISRKFSSNKVFAMNLFGWVGLVIIFVGLLLQNMDSHFAGIILLFIGLYFTRKGQREVTINK